MNRECFELKPLNRFFLLFVVLQFFAAPIVLIAQDQSGTLDERIQKLEDENSELKEIINQLKTRLDTLEGEKKPEEMQKEPKEKKGKSKTDAKKESGTVENVSKEASNEEVEPWLPSMRGETFQFGGRLQAEFFERESDNRFQSAIPDNDGGTFHVDEMRIYLDADFKNYIRFHSAYDVESNDEGLVEAFIEAEELPLNSTLMVGLQPRFFRPSRYTESLPITGTAYWRSRDIGVAWKSTFELATVYFSVMNGAELDSQELGEDQSAFIIGEDDTNIDLNGNKEINGGIGFEYDFDKFGKIEVIGFGVVSELSNDDVLFLQNNVPGYGFSNNDTRYYAGANLDYAIDEWDFFAQYIAGQDGTIDRSSWYAELSYKWAIEGMRYLNSIRPLVRYGVLDVDYPPSPFVRNGSLIWDRRQWLFGVISEIVDNVNFRFEYMLNEEDTGGPSVNNDEFLFQMEIVF